MNDFEEGVASYLGAEALEKIASVRVGIAGAGGLGSNCAVNLVRSGFKRIIIADFDVVEFSNLNRQFYFGDQVGKPKVFMLRDNLLRINPDLEIEALNMKIDAENVGAVFDGCDAVVEAFDRVECKKMLVERYLNSDKLLVAASGIAGWGNSDTIGIKRIRDNFFMVGDMVSESGRELPPLSPGVTIAAAKQADVVLSRFLNG